MPRPDLSTLRWPRRTHRLVLRPLTVGDVDAVLAFRSLPEVVLHLSHDVLDRDQVEARIGERIARGLPGAEEPLLGLAVVEPRTGRVIGDVMLRLEPSHSITGDGTDEWEGTIGYALHPDAQGRGFAAEAAAELLVIGFRDLGLRRVTATRTPTTSPRTGCCAASACATRRRPSRSPWARTARGSTTTPGRCSATSGEADRRMTGG